MHPLATRYPSVCARRGIELRTTSDEVLQGEFASFCHEFRDGIAQRCAVRATQTNEVGRCAAIRPALAWLALRGHRSIGLLDAGCSAGLNLFVDAYGYNLGGHAAGSPGAVPMLTCELRGAVPPLELPAITHRVGLDLSPIDVTDDDGVAWLLACLWPDDLDRFERLAAAVDVVGSRRDELRIVRGDMVDALEEAASLAEGAEQLVVLDCWSTAYLPPARRGAFADAVASLALHRPVSWVTLEFPSVARDLGVLPDGADPTRTDASVVCVTEFDGAARRSMVLGHTHHHGAWLDWAAAAPPSARGASL